MATKTKKLGLSKAELTDAVRSTLMANNNNFDKLDNAHESMQSQVDRLRANQISGSANGTEITVEDSAEMESILKVSGNSEQDSRSGKNLFDINNKYAVGQSFTNAGITVTYNENGYITLNGTASGNVDIEIVPRTYTITLDKDIYLCFEKSSGTSNTNKGFACQAINKSGVSIWSYSVKESSPILKVPYSDIVSIKWLRIAALSGDSFTDYKIRVWVSTENSLNWEPYGVQPSPDYPSEIRSVKSKSDNLFLTSESKTINGITSIQNSDGSLTINGTATANTFLSAKKNINEAMLEQGQTYTLSTNQSIDGVTCYMELYNDSTFVKTEIQLPSGETSITKAISSSVGTRYGFVVMISAGTTLNNITIKPMLNKGTVALPYQPYGYVPVEAKVEGKNLLPFDDKTFTVGGITFNCKDGEIFANGTSTSEISSGNQIYPDNFTFVLSAGTYTFQANLKGLSSYNIPCYIKKKSDGSVLGTINGNGTKSVMFTLTEKTELYLGIYLYQQTLNNVNLYLMLEKGSTATPYIPHVAPNIVSLPLGDIELRSTPDGTRDTFVRVDGVWNKVSNIGSLTLNGTEDIRLNAYYNAGDYIAFVPTYLNAKWEKTASQAYSDKFTIITDEKKLQIAESSVMYLGSTTSSQIFFKLHNSIATTVEECKTWLSSNHTEVIYPLYTPTYTPITDPVLISALDELESLILHKGYNRITVTSVNGVKAYLDLSYVKDINIVLDNINATMLALGGGTNV